MRIRCIARMLYVQEDVVRGASRSLGKPEKAEQQTQNRKVLHCTSQKTDDVDSIKGLLFGFGSLFISRSDGRGRCKSTAAFLIAVLYKIADKGGF